MSLSAAAWSAALVLVLAAAGLSRARRRREDAAWQEWMTDTGGEFG